MVLLANVADTVIEAQVPIRDISRIDKPASIPASATFVSMSPEQPSDSAYLLVAISELPRHP